MATLKLYRNKLKHNYQCLNRLIHSSKIEMAIVTKLLCGNKLFLEEVVNLGNNQICDSRLSNLKVIKQIDPKTETIYIKPPAKNTIPSLVKYADISLNTQYETIKLISKEAQKQKKLHKIIIMVEMGDLREGVLKKDLVSFYQKIFKLKGIKVIGLGTNLNCLHGVMPTADKLIQLGLYKQIIELKFKQKLPLLSGGSTVSLPLIKRKQLPSEINHFRVGEALYFGADLFNGGTLPGFYDSVFELNTQIIELSQKPHVPEGEIKENPSGELFEVKDEMYGKYSTKAIMDIGLLDINPDFLIAEDDDIEIVGASSDMLVIDLGKNTSDYKVGDIIKFKMKYMGALSLMNSYYVEKVVV
jgi:predicted amino acid racemase